MTAGTSATPEMKLESKNDFKGEGDYKREDDFSARLTAEVVEECRGKGIDKPIVASLVGDTEVEEASEYLYERGIVAYPYTTEVPVEVLGAKYRWARSAGLL